MERLFNIKSPDVADGCEQYSLCRAWKFYYLKPAKNCNWTQKQIQQVIEKNTQHWSQWSAHEHLLLISGCFCYYDFHRLHICLQQ